MCIFAVLPSEGDGSTGNPYIITKAAELAWFRNEVNGGQYSICAKIAANVFGLKKFTEKEVREEAIRIYYGK